MRRGNGNGGGRHDSKSIADVAAEFVELELGCAPPVGLRFWDGSTLGPEQPVGTIVVNSAVALTRLLWDLSELGLARAYVSGELDIEGDVVATLGELRGALLARTHAPSRPRALLAALRGASRLGAIGRRPAPPAEEVALSGGRHSPMRDARAIEHHYDLGNDFYRIVLGPSMTYSCARFVSPEDSLEEAQRAKHDLICRKLGLDERPGMRLLDVGCGWGSLAVHAANAYDARVVAITLSAEQHQFAEGRVKELELDNHVDVRLMDYRELSGEQFDAISSVGMFEHVGRAQMATYFSTLARSLAPKGRLLNHAISKPGGSPMARGGFINRYVFPDGELLDVTDVLRAMQTAGLEVRDVESLREHYVMTLRCWLANLDAMLDQAVELVGAASTRIWRLYMAASANAFAAGAISVHQVLGVATGPSGDSGMPRTRVTWR